MKKFAIALFLSALAVPAAANEIRSSITDSVSLTVQGAAVQSTRIGSSYSANGSNVTVTTLGGLSVGSATAPSAITDGAYSVNGTGAFTFGESALTGDTPVTSQTAAAGAIASPNLYGNSTTQLAGEKGSLAGVLYPSSVPTVTAGGPGTSAIGQRTVEMTVFQ